MNKVPYFTMIKNDQDQSVDIIIYGDITPYKWDDSDTDAYSLVKQLDTIPADAAITVHINSNGGDVKEALGIYNQLKGRNVTTVCEGFAASAASIIFCAGKTRIMHKASLLFIHNAMTIAAGNADEMDKAAEDLRIITAAAVAAYREAGVNVSDEDLKDLMDAESWITPDDAVEMGFATQIADDDADDSGAYRNDCMRNIIDRLTSKPAMAVHLAPESVAEIVDALTKTTATTPAPVAPVEHKGLWGFRD